jgi:hypothetical protein
MADLEVTIVFEGMALKAYFNAYPISPSLEGPVEVVLTCPEDEPVET